MSREFLLEDLLGGNMNRLKDIFTPEEVLRGLPVGVTVFYYENGIHILQVSEEAGNILSYSTSEYIELFQNSIELIFEDKLQEFESEINKLTPGGIPLNYTIYSPNKQGEYRWINLCVSVEVRDEYRVYYLISKDVSGVKEALDEKAMTDSMTGLLNRGAFEDEFNIKVKAHSTSEEHAFILIDIDNFKNINDTYGHQKGDKVIRIVADILKKSFREDDLVARLGGDEFAIVFWNVKSQENIKKRIEMIFNYLHGIGNQLDNSNIISISIGVVCFPNDGGGFDNLYNKADSEMYKVKRKHKGDYSIAN